MGSEKVMNARELRKYANEMGLDVLGNDGRRHGLVVQATTGERMPFPEHRGELSPGVRRVLMRFIEKHSQTE